MSSVIVGTLAAASPQTVPPVPTTADQTSEADGHGEVVHSFTQVLSRHVIKGANDYNESRDPKPPLQKAKSISQKGGHRSSSGRKEVATHKSDDTAMLGVPVVELAASRAVQTVAADKTGAGAKQEHSSRVFGLAAGIAADKTGTGTEQLHPLSVPNLAEDARSGVGGSTHSRSVVDLSASRQDVTGTRAKKSMVEPSAIGENANSVEGAKAPEAASNAPLSIAGHSDTRGGEVAQSPKAVLAASGENKVVHGNGLFPTMPKIYGEPSLVQGGVKANDPNDVLIHSVASSVKPTHRAGSGSALSSKSENSAVSSVSSAVPGMNSGLETSVPVIHMSPSGEGSKVFDVKILSEVISRPLSDGNGTYTVVVAMHPADLGHLHAVMSLGSNGLQVSITPETQVGHNALAGVMDSLKNQLAGGGMDVNVTLRDPGSQPGPDAQKQSSGSHNAFAATPVGPTSATRSATAVLATGQIHLIL